MFSCCRCTSFYSRMPRTKTLHLVTANDQIENSKICFNSRSYTPALASAATGDTHGGRAALGRNFQRHKTSTRGTCTLMQALISPVTEQRSFFCHLEKEEYADNSIYLFCAHKRLLMTKCQQWKVSDYIQNNHGAPRCWLLGGQKSFSICGVTHRPAQSTVKWDAFKTNSSLLSLRMSQSHAPG